MRQVYTIETNNAFAALAGEGSDEEMVQPKPAATQAPQQAHVPVGLTQAPRAPRAAPAQSAPRPTGAGARPPRRPAAADDDEPITAIPPRMGDTRMASRDAPRRPRPAKDERLDRHSGTGRGRENKKDGGGRHNWGNQPADFGAEVDPAALKVPGEDGAEEDAAAGAEKPAAEEPAKPAEPVTMTLKDYEAQQGPLIAPKAAVSGEARVESGYQLYTKAVDDAPARSAPTVTAAEAAAAAAKKTMGLNFRFQNGPDRRGPRRDGPESGRRGANDRERTDRRPRGDGPNGTRPPRDGNNRPPRRDAQQKPNGAADQHTIDLADQQAFPTLEAH